MKRGMLVAALCIGILISLSSQASAFIVYSEDFESFDSSGWNFDVDSNGSLWHITQNFPLSGSYALGFVKDETPGDSPNGNYEGPWYSTCSGPAITVPTMGNTILSLKTYYEGDGGYCEDWDVFSIWVNDYTNPLATTWADYEDGDQTIPYGGYWTMTFDLTSFAGQEISLAFNFNAFDGQSNDYPGARIDDIQIINDFVSTPEPASMALLGLGLLGMAGLRKRKTHNK